MALDYLKGLVQTVAAAAATIVEWTVQASRGTVTSPVVVQDDDVLWQLPIKGFDGTGYVLLGYLKFQVDDTPGTNDMPGKFSVWLSPDGSATPTKVFEILMDGTVTVVNGATFGGGYGSTGLTITAAGVLTMNGAFTADGVIQCGNEVGTANFYVASAAGSAAAYRYYNGAVAANAGLNWSTISNATTFIWALGRYIAGTFQDFPIAVSNATGVVTILKQAIFSAGLVTTPVALTDGANIATNAALGNTFTVTLGGNRTMDAPTNATNGLRICYRIRQDGTGSRTLSWDAAFRFSTTRPSPTLSTTAAKVDYVEFMYNSTDSKWDVVNIDLGH